MTIAIEAITKVLHLWKAKGEFMRQELKKYDLQLKENNAYVSELEMVLDRLKADAAIEAEPKSPG